MQEKGLIGAGALVDLVSDFYTASMDGRFWPTVLTKLREALEAHACAIASHDFTAGVGTLEHVVGIDVDAIESYGRVFSRINPWLRREENFRTAGTVWLGSELLDDSEVERSDFQRSWLEPCGLASQVFGVLDWQAGRALFVYALRQRNAPPFGPDQTLLLRRLLPYLQRGLRAGQMLRRTQHARQAALEALDVMPIGVVLLSANGVVLAANKVGRSALANREGLTIGRNGLEFMERGRRILLQDVIRDATQPVERNRPVTPQTFTIDRPQSGRSLSILVWPVREAGAATVLEDAAAMMFIGDPDQSVDISEERLKSLYGLTGAEARVAALLARGYRLDEIAEMLGVAYETTRKHLKQIFGKTSTARQADLVRIVMTGPGGLSA